MGWSEDLTYDYFSRIVQALQQRFALIQMGEVPTRGIGEKPFAVVRHDLDVCLQTGVRMARIEHAADLRATYMLLINSPFYQIESPASRAAISELVDLGHEVALHFDIDDYPKPPEWDAETLGRYVAEAGDRLSQIAGQPVRSFSFHRPIPQLLRGEAYVGGLINSYASDLMDWYISDSKGNWREGEPLPQLSLPRGPLLQILIHPIWWGPDRMDPEDRLEAFRHRLLAERPDMDYESLGQLIYDVLVVRPRSAPRE